MRRLLPAAMALLAACSTLDPTAPGNLVPRTVDEDASLPSLALDGTVFHAQTIGPIDAPVVVFLHGGPGGDYRSLLRLADRVNGFSLADRHRLVFWDQRGAGLSRRHDRGDLSMELYQQDLLAIVNHYSPNRPVILIGQSWGAMFATAFVNRHPDPVAGLVLIESGPLTGETFERIKHSMFDIDLGAEWLNDMAWNGEFLSADDHVRMDYARMIGMKVSQPKFHERVDPDPEPSWRLGAAASRYILEDGQDGHGHFVFDFTDHLSAFHHPVLFVAGERSEVLGPSLQREQMKHFASARLDIVAGAGHDAHWTHASTVIGFIRDYLTALEGQAE